MSDPPARTATLDEEAAWARGSRRGEGAPEGAERSGAELLADLPLGALERYRDAVEHGRGGRGRVLRARDAVLDRTVAIKELLDPDDRMAAARMVREALVTARLQHPSIVPVYEAARRPTGEPFYVMKLVEGRSLHDEVSSRRALAERLGLLGHVIAAAEAVGYAHQHGIVHRDLKPANIIVGAFGETVVIDWGLAKDLHHGDRDVVVADALYDVVAADMTCAGTVLGTPAFMAPEQARGEPIDARADVYALGAVLYYVLVGAPPYAATTSRDALAMVRRAPPPPVRAREPRVPRELVAIVETAMARDPAARYPHAKALAEDLERFRTGRLVLAQHYSVSMRARRWLARHRTAVASAAVVSLVAAMFAVRARVDHERRIRARLAEADAALASAAPRKAALEDARAKALARFDAGNFDGGDETWEVARAYAASADRAYAEASHALEAALVLEPQRSSLRARFAHVLFDRAELAAVSFSSDLRDELLRRLANHDDGTLAARLTAPARLRVRAVPPDARVRLTRFDRGRGMPQGTDDWTVERGLQKEPQEIPLVPGVYALDAEAPGFAETRLVVAVAPGARREVEVMMLRSAHVPAGFVHVPAGTFQFGSDDHEAIRRELHTAPLHEVATDAYLIARHEVTFADWIAYLESLPPSERARRTPAAKDRGHELRLEPRPEGGYTLHIVGGGVAASAREGESVTLTARWKRASQDWRRWPVTGVSLYDVDAYAAWLDQTGRVPHARVCTELEWERAARGADARRYPHGDRLDDDEANIDETYDRDPGALGPDEVGAHPASRSPYGVDDLAGNVWEWVRAVDGRAGIRGGGWYTNDSTARSDNRELSEANQRDPLVGVRLCATPKR